MDNLGLFQNFSRDFLYNVFILVLKQLPEQNGNIFFALVCKFFREITKSTLLQYTKKKKFPHVFGQCVLLI